ncbi:MIP/aquaporin family protein [Streptomyces sodiiphilus]|uniref:MIP/aquaporin family protein n=1 Tax=Streptomyces sodiiphilus TaxID=226217 RepID=A0ABN2PWS2_9ACTN
MSSFDIFIGETIGTTVLILMGGGVVAGVILKRSKSFGAGWVAIAFGWGLAVMTAVYIAGQVSGAHINPAVTLGIALDTGDIWGQVPYYFAGQLLGAMLGATLCWLAYYGHFRAHLRDREIVGGSGVPGPEALEGEQPVEERPAARRDEPGPVLAIFATSPEIRVTWQNLVTEIIATTVLVLAVLRIALDENAQVSGLGGLLVALVVVALGLSLGGPTGYAINPARDLGPRIVHSLLPLPNKGGSDWSYAWVPVVGPFTGGALAALVHQLAF